MTKDIMDLPIILRNVQSGRGYVTTMGHFLGEKAQFLTTSELGQLYRLGNEVIPLTVGGKLITVERQHKVEKPAAKAPEAKVVQEVLSDRSVVWNVEYVDGLTRITVGCVDQSAAELLAECLNEASWVQADVGETVGRAVE